MKLVCGWWMPDHEAHLGPWMEAPKNRLTLNGRQAYQGKKQIAAMNLVKQHRVACDIGGHVGTWSFNLAHEFATVFAFEPVAEHRACFERNLQGVGQHVHLKAMALGASEGMISIATEKGSSGNSTVSGKGDIPMHTLDSLELQDVDFVKIDVEGLEESVLRGGEQTLRQWKPVVVVEQKRNFHERFNLPHLGAVTFLKSLGYKLVDEISGDYFLTHPDA